MGIRDSRSSRYGDCSPYPSTEPCLRLWLVDVPLTRHAPNRSQRAAFLHWAPHVADFLTNPCVFISIPHRINSPVFIQPLSAAQVSSAGITTSSSLSSEGITLHHRYYEAVRLPVIHPVSWHDCTLYCSALTL